MVSTKPVEQYCRVLAQEHSASKRVANDLIHEEDNKQDTTLKKRPPIQS